MAGRGFGKSRTGAETVRQMVENGAAGRIALVGATAADTRDVMVEGEAGLLSVFPPNERPIYEPSKRRITFANNAVASCYSAEEPSRLRGPAHDFAWCDELAAWRFVEDTYDMMMLGLRLGKDPRVVVTTTPKPIPLIKQMINDTKNVHVTRGTTYENIENLAQAFVEQIVRRYEGTRLGRQELNAEILDDTPGALWQRAKIDSERVSEVPEFVRVVVAIDPQATNNRNSAETGIVVAARDGAGHGYVVEDASIKESPSGWANVAVTAYRKHKADRIIAESNQGGDMVSHTIATVDPNVPVKLVHASRGKQTRAEPIAAFYEQGKIHHFGFFGDLEDQLCTWVPGDDSPDRLDALVWALTELMIGKQPARRVKPVSGLVGASRWR